MYAGRVVVSHVEFAPRALSRLEKRRRVLLTLVKQTGRTDGRTDGHQTETLLFPLDAASVTRKTINLTITTTTKVDYFISPMNWPICLVVTRQIGQFIGDVYRK